MTTYVDMSTTLPDTGDGQQLKKTERSCQNMRFQLQFKRDLCEKRGGKQRLVLDCRTINLAFKRPPPMEIGAADCICRRAAILWSRPLTFQCASINVECSPILVNGFVYPR